MLRTEGMLSIIALLDFYRILAITTGVFILIFVYFMYKNRNHSKIGGIKAFCDKYLDCKF